jgi:hypothetical protein
MKVTDMLVMRILTVMDMIILAITLHDSLRQVSPVNYGHEHGQGYSGGPPMVIVSTVKGLMTQ